MLIAVDSVGAADITVFVLANLRCIRIFLRMKYAANRRGRRRQEERVKIITIIVNSFMHVFRANVLLSVRSNVYEFILNSEVIAKLK